MIAITAYSFNIKKKNEKAQIKLQNTLKKKEDG